MMDTENMQAVSSLGCGVARDSLSFVCSVGCQRAEVERRQERPYSGADLPEEDPIRAHPAPP